MSLKLGECFAGYGGLGMAVEQIFNAETAWFSEFEAAPSKILAHHWPTVPNHGDITKINWHDVEPVDIISGGSPCQDLSLAGKRRGMQGGTRSNLWESMREAIAIIKPTYVVWENVRGALSAGAYSEMEQSTGRLGDTGGPNLRAIGRVLGDLADLGFDAEWRGLRAADVGAPHARYRIFILAANRDNVGEHRGWQVNHQAGWGEPAHRRDTPAHARSIRRDQGHEPAERRTEGQDRAGVANERGAHDQGTNWGDYAHAIRRWESAMGRRAPAPTEPTGRNGNHRLSPAFAEFMMGLPAGWITDVPGITWAEQLKACGNGVVPQQAAAALADMLASFESLEVAA